MRCRVGLFVLLFLQEHALDYRVNVCVVICFDVDDSHRVGGFDFVYFALRFGGSGSKCICVCCVHNFSSVWCCVFFFQLLVNGI